MSARCQGLAELWSAHIALLEGLENKELGCMTQTHGVETGFHAEGRNQFEHGVKVNP